MQCNHSSEPTERSTHHQSAPVEVYEQLYPMYKPTYKWILVLLQLLTYW